MPSPTLGDDGLFLGPALPVGLGELVFSHERQSILVCYALGSCVGLAAQDPNTKISAMAHIVLPRSQGRLAGPPARYADLGVKSLIHGFMQRGIRPERLQVKIAGGARILALQGVPALDIGNQNSLAVLDALKSYDIAILAQDTGGSYGRTAELSIASGILRITTVGKPPKYL